MDPSDITTQQEAGAGSPRAAPVTPSGAPPGVAIPGYVVEGLLGQGGMGAVYLARDEALGRQVAIKIVLDGRAAKEDARARFRREARVMASVEHPNVVRLYSFGVAGDSDYLVMEYVDGETLAKRLARAGALSEDEGLRVFRQMLLGLEAAWEKGIVHRDVKPSNVMVDQKGRVLVADFGLAKAAAQDSDDSSITTGQTVLGTPHYLSPEQAQGQPVDLRSDMYSAGLVLYEMLTGERPFAAATPAAVVARRLTEPAPDIGARRPGLSTRTASIYRWMVERSPADRPGSYADLIAALDGREGANRTTQTRLSRPPVARTAFLSLPPLPRVAALCIAGLAALGALWGLAQLMSAPADLPRPTIAVAPFYGPDPESAREGRVAAALIERALVDRAATTPIRVTGIEETREVIRSHEAARALGVRLNAGLVVWGEAFAFGGRTQFQPYVTRAAQVVPSRPVYRVFETGAGTQAEQSAARYTIASSAPDSIDLQRTSADGVGTLATSLLGLQLLYEGQNPRAALRVFGKLPEDSASLTLRAWAWLALDDPIGRPGSAVPDTPSSTALVLAERALAAEPANTNASLARADALRRLGRDRESFAVLWGALEQEGGLDARLGFLEGESLYAVEMYPGQSGDSTGYLLRVAKPSFTVVGRIRAPGRVVSLSRRGDAVSVLCQSGWSSSPASPVAAEFRGGRFAQALGAAPAVWERMALWRVAGAGELPGIRELTAAAGAPLGEADLSRLRAADAALALRAAADETNPVFPVLRGAVLAKLGEAAAATSLWERALRPDEEIPYSEFVRTALYFERLGYPQWADRAMSVALERRQQNPQPAWACYPWRMDIAVWGLPEPRDPLRSYAWYARLRRLAGPEARGGDITSAVWSEYFRRSGNTALAETEAVASRGMAKSPLNEIARRVRADVWLLLVMATSAGALGLALSIPGRADAGRALAATACVALLATGFTAWQGSRTFAELEAFDDVAGFALSDSLARPEVTGRLESLEKLSPDVRRRWVLATAYHLAGDRARADGLYAEAGLDSRAKRNRSALLEARGPVEFPSAPEVAAALTPGAALPAAQSSDAPIALLLGPALLAWAALAIAVLVRYLGWKPTLPRWLAFVTHVAVPGARELARGAPTRGWATLALAAGIGWVLLFANIKRGAVGVFTCRAIPDYWPPTVPDPLEAYRWTAFWAVPYARLVWPLLLAGALLLIAEHGRVVLAAWKERAAVPTGR